MRSDELWRRFAFLGVPTTLYAVLTRPGAQPSDAVAAVGLLPFVAVMFWVSYPVFSRFLQVEPTRLTAAEFALDVAALGALGLALDLEGSGWPLAARLPLGLVGALGLAYISALVRQRERDGDTATSFFAD